MKNKRHIIKEHKKKLRKKHALHIPRHFPSIEESHGYPEVNMLHDHTFHLPKTKKPNYSNGVNQWIIAMVFFIVFTFLLTQLREDAAIKRWIYNALDEDFPFAATYDWYEGNIHRLGLFDISPPNKETEEMSYILDDVVETFQSTGTSMSVSPKSKIDIPALADGIVVFSGKDRYTNLTVVVQQDDQSKVVYGNLSKIAVPLYKRVRQQDVIGSFQPAFSEDAYSLSIMKDGDFIDPYVFIAEQNE